MYCELYPDITRSILTKLEENPSRQIHGSHVHEIVLDFFAGKRSADSHDTEKFLTELVDAKKLVVLQKAPTLSQSVFAGLTYSTTSYRALGWVAGIKTHFWYRAP